jgi:hypothetical protein
VKEREVSNTVAPWSVHDEHISEVTDFDGLGPLDTITKGYDI